MSVLAEAVPPIPVYYFSSSSGMVRRFAESLDRPTFDLSHRHVRLSVPRAQWVLLTPSYKTGNPDNDTVPEAVRRFLQNQLTRRRMVGVMGSGNRNFGSAYQASCRQIARASGRPVLFEFELQGTPWDVQEARRILDRLDQIVASGRANQRGESTDCSCPSPKETPCPVPHTPSSVGRRSLSRS